MSQVNEPEKKGMKNLFLQKKPCSIMLAIASIEKPYVSILMKEADTTFAHTTNILSDMEAFGMVEFVSEGRVKYVKLTRRGKEIVKSMQQLDSALEGGNVLKDLKRLEVRVNGLEARIKSGKTDDKSIKRFRKSLDESVLCSDGIESESRLFQNDHLDYEIKVMKERLEYLKNRLDDTGTPA